MVHRTAAFVVLQLIAIQNVYSQVVNRVVPNCGQNIVPELMIGTPTVTPLVMERPYEVAPTIIQDSSVANSLANALQLLVVSNLLSTTLPSPNCEVFASYLPQGTQYFQVPGQQYYQIPSTPSHSTTNPYASTHSHTTVNSYTPPSSSVYQPSASLYHDYSYSPASPQITTYKPPVAPVTTVQPPKEPPLTPTKLKISPTLPSKGFDSNVLNNLAIALQLLIVSNLLNSPISESLPNMRNGIQQKIEYETIQPANSHAIYTNKGLPQYQTQDYQAYFESNPYESPNPSYPNANYLGSSHNLGGLLGAIPPATPRQGLKLQSPYDALANGFAEHLPVFEQNKRDFQSPYAAILAADNTKDLFSMDFY
ncbi:hypothetical protein RR46_12543 [Papilio xuthus]|uniref:Uncharacterized protein n=1 Tax=Papilio xuthus TaxID=66420 RepID=A0A194PU60_PAPXU|nr:hypothetical protein RR46_12543 [Papilio xuthus]